MAKGASKGNKGKKPSAKKQVLHYVIDCEIPVADGTLNVEAFEKYLQERIKVNGKAGVLGDKVTVSRDKASIHINAVAPFSKRYLKYLSKKYLKSANLRDYLRLSATGKDTYTVKYYDIQQDEDEDED